MKLWSRGLGSTEVFMDFRYYKTIKDPDGDNVSIIGNMRDPVNWEFKITLEPEDIPGFIKAFFHFCLIKLVTKNLHRYIVYLFNRKKYVGAGNVDIEQRVKTAYEQMMRRVR